MSLIATIAEEDTEAAETTASFDNHEVIETPVDDIDDTIFDSNEDAVPPLPKLENPIWEVPGLGGTLPVILPKYL
jgi:hypothetical protein